ncbi:MULTISPECIES: translocation/assembly module TamB domain-containing protein [unclassified Herbaspirillum]|uniref:translocation/assembly module TamB domain-containing protein n=1 Tax=unclassified Herbaspirillum TaxID=2624150 RepID=UPI001154B483|nr:MULTISPECIES: translocation/assembly module TamB domain-containing protein [unclassified Herbaspirillum]MBB5391076.1 translocation and assembly module TamB [Herbaspirillum sp. SJZ102]TQK13233.1 autotransporter secretion inner membrane protein TamB [Herbaspirillum sp. SJZ130]TQK15237.1 autotransporter secretion inner membrane protein TamB [Herbaspirillum sp. SJZ106]
MSDQQASPSAPDPHATPPRQKPRRVRKIALWSGATLAAALLVVAGAGLYAVKTESGARLVWNGAVQALGGKLSGQLLGGTIANGLRLRDLHYQDAQRILDIDRIDADWQLSPLQRKFSVRYLRVGTVTLKQQPSPSEPSVMPASLEIPLALDIHEISLERLSFTEGSSTTELSKLRLHGDSDGTQHTLVLDSLSTPFGDAAALLHLNGRAPFAISGGLELSGQYQNASLQEKYQLAAQLSGSLQDLGIALKASGDRLNGTADVQATPFAPVPLKSAKVDLQHINPQTFSAGAPQADLRVRADLAPVAGTNGDALRVAGKIAIDNARPGSLDQQLLPLLSASADVDLDLQRQKIASLELRLPRNARIAGGGEFRPGSDAAGQQQEMGGSFNFRISALDLNQIHRQLKPTQLAGPLDVTLAPGSQQIKLALDDRELKLRVDSTIRPEEVELHQAQLAAGKSRVEAAGTLKTAGAMDYAIKGRLVDFDPTAWLHAVAPAPAAGGKKKPGASAASKPVQARINMDFNASGAISPELKLKLAFGIRDSSYGDLPMSGQGDISVAGMRLLPSKANLLVAGNTLDLNGSFGAGKDALTLKVDAPHLERLGYGLSGLLRLDGQLTGTPQRPNLHATYQAEKLAFGPHHLARLAGETDLRTDLAAGIASPNNKLALRVEGEGYRGPQAELSRLDLNLDGTWGNHTLTLHGAGKVLDQPLDLDFAAHGKVTEKTRGKYGWAGNIDKLQNKGFPQVTLASPLALEASADALEAGATRLEIDRMALDLKRLSWRQGRIASAGQVRALDLGRLLQIVQEFTGTPPPVKTDLVLDSDWDFALAESASGYFQLTRKSGDMRVTASNGEAALGLSELRLRADLQGQQVRVDGRVAAARVGTIDLGGTLGLQRIDGLLALADASPLNLKAKLEVPELKRTGDLIGPQVSLNGKLGAEFNAGGTLGQPKLSGAINGDNLAVTHFDQGIQLKDGIVRIVMDNNVIDLRQIEFHGGKGTLRAQGKVQLGAENPDLNATITADRLELFASPDRQLMLSGQGKIANINEQLHIDGKFIVDRALFDLPKSSAPTLGDDVVIVRRDGKTKAGANASSQQKLEAATEKPAGKFAPVMNIAVDLGHDFRFRGTGADLLLRGDMNVRSEPLSPLRATGTINVAEGTYEAFGTKLNIERGIINFQGPISNPNINILAMRRNQDVEAGVSVTGTANRPRVQLVSEPNVPDDEKLSWMMFGHGTDSSSIGQRSASSQALALVGNLGGKRIAKDFGLDQFSIGASESGLTDDQVVNLGKAITEKITLGYEQSLQGAASIAKATWQLSRRWSVVVRAGTITGLNVLFNLRYD